jgi:seryl-tRNA synthetase
MLDIKLIRDNPELVRDALEKRGEKASLDQILNLDQQRRQLLHEMETLRAHHNEVNKQLGKMADKPHQLITEMRQLGEKVASLEAEISQVGSDLEDLLLRLPNIPAVDVPVGKDTEDNIVVRTWGKPPDMPFTPLPHWELAEKLDIIDFQRGVKLSGSRFYVLKGPGAHLQRALITFMLDLHVKEHGYTEIYPPFMVKRECMVGSGNLPKFADNLYHDAEDDFWFVPTAEVPLTNLHRDELIPPASVERKWQLARTPGASREVINSIKSNSTSSRNLRRRIKNWRSCWTAPKTYAVDWVYPTALYNCVPATLVLPQQNRSILKCGLPAAENGWR